MNTPATHQAPAERTVLVRRPQITLAMILCGIVSAAGIGAASAATQADEDAPSIVVKYNPQRLSTDSGAQAVYRELVAAAEEVCPAHSGRFALSPAVRACRAQSISRAVMQINDSKLAAIHDSASRNG
jgi:UrcA family protein